jgi:hypothetical protein
MQDKPRGDKLPVLLAVPTAVEALAGPLAGRKADQ